MWLFELVLLSLVGGAILGIGLRAYDEYTEKRKAELKNQ
jgi:hypothetical protein